MSEPLFKAKAIYSWSGNKKTLELGFIEGDIIEIFKIVDDLTFYGRSMRSKLNGKFPSKFVEVISEEENISRSSSKLSLKLSSPISKSNSSIKTLKKINKSSSSTLNSEMFSLGEINNSHIHSHTNIHNSVSNSNSNSNSNSDFDEEINDSSFSSIPPLPPKHAELNQSKKFKSSYVQQLLDISTFSNSTDTEKSSTFGHSDFSATSAGSFMRHKEQNFQNRLQNLKETGTNSQESQKILTDIVQRNEKTKHPNFFKKLVGSKANNMPSFDDRLYLSTIERMNKVNISQDDSIPFGGSARSSSPASPNISNSHSSFHSNSSSSLSELERTKTLNGRERAERSSRVLSEEPEIILKPHKCITSMNNNEIEYSFKKTYSIDSATLSHVDKFIDSLPIEPFNSIEKIMNDCFLKKFKTDLEITRAIYSYLTTRFKIIEKNNEKLSIKSMPNCENLNDIIHNGCCTSHQLTWLFYLMAIKSGLKVEIILGYFKSPFSINNSILQNNTKLTLNHSWISILIENEYRLIDITLGNPTNNFFKNGSDDNDDNDDENNLIFNEIENFKFYFLTRPRDLVYTHTPRHIDQQHIIPPIDPVAQLSLPPLYPSFINNGIKLYKYNSSIFKLNDFEIFEFEIEIPINFELIAKFKPFDSQFSELNLFVQIYWKNNIRLAKIKGILSKDCPVGFIYVLGKNIEIKNFTILLSIPCFHKGKWKPLHWCNKNVTNLKILDVDLYVKSPQTFEINFGKCLFDIKIFNHNFDSEYNYGLMNPKGEFFKLNKTSNENWKTEIEINQLGSWKLVVPDKVNKVWKVVVDWNAI